MRGADMPDGPSLLGSLAHGVPVIIRDGIANMPSFECFAGSVATTDRLVRVMTQKAGLPIWEAVKMASLNAAATLRIDGQYGSIEAGKTADLLIFDDDIRISAVYVNGKQQF
jgi:N-acetylglucosamine-6-phosphate deacetylase